MLFRGRGVNRLGFMVSLTVKRPFCQRLSLCSVQFLLQHNSLFEWSPSWNNHSVMAAPHRDDHIFEYKEGQWQASSRAGVGRTRPPYHHAKDHHEETCTLRGYIEVLIFRKKKTCSSQGTSCPGSRRLLSPTGSPMAGDALHVWMSSL